MTSEHDAWNVPLYNVAEMVVMVMEEGGVWLRPLRYTSLGLLQEYLRVLIKTFGYGDRAKYSIRME